MRISPISFSDISSSIGPMTPEHIVSLSGLLLEMLNFPSLVAESISSILCESSSKSSNVTMFLLLLNLTSLGTTVLNGGC